MEYTYSFIFISSLFLSLSHSSNQLILLFSLFNLYPSISPSTSFHPTHPSHPPHLSTGVMNPSTCESGDSLSVDVSKPQILGIKPFGNPQDLLLHVQNQPRRCADNEDYVNGQRLVAQQLHLPMVVAPRRENHKLKERQTILDKASPEILLSSTTPAVNGFKEKWSVLASLFLLVSRCGFNALTHMLLQ